MLQQICEKIHNYFICKDRSKTQRGTFEIADGMITLSFVKEGQRFLLVGSDLNDGIYTYHADGIKNDDDTEAAGLQDETFAGTICALAVPPAVIALSEEIKQWEDSYGESVKGPYQSEEVIGVYSYTKATATGRNGNAEPVTWQTQFASQLDRWRKVAF